MNRNFAAYSGDTRLVGSNPPRTTDIRPSQGLLRTALLAVPFVFAGLTTGHAQVVTDPQVVITVVPPVIQNNPAGNALGPRTLSALPPTSTPGDVVVFESPDAQSLASAVARVQGVGAIGTPVAVTQTTNNFALNLNVANTVDQDFVATAIAEGGEVDITNTLVAGGTNALSDADAISSLDSSVRQINANSFAANNATQNAGVVQSNDNGAGDFGQSFFATSIATGGPVTVTSSGPVASLTFGVDANSTADARSRISSLVEQTNDNITQAPQRNGDLDQDQNLTQTNDNDESLFATSIAVSGPVTVTRDGDTVASTDGVSAASTANATAAIDTPDSSEAGSRVSQTNDNLLNAFTTTNNDEIEQDQGVSQSNENDGIFVATGVAVSGDVAASNVGDMDAGGNGIAAQSRATAQTAITSVVDRQRNENDQSASSDLSNSGSEVEQAQDVGQTNDNEGLSVATSVAVSGDVAAANEGKTKAGLDGLAAVSQAQANASIGTVVIQENDNGIEGESNDDLEQVQVLNQTNANSGIAVATSVAVAGDVAASRDGKTEAGLDGVNAVSAANANAVIGGENGNLVLQSNVNEMEGRSEGGGGLVQTQGGTEGIQQSNQNTGLAIGTAVAVSGDVAVSSKGDTTAGLDGVNARSVANSTAGAASNTGQLNGNLAFSNTDREDIDVSQTVEQNNDNEQWTFATSVSVAGDVAVERKGWTKADGNGVDAVSEAAAGAGVRKRVDQENINLATTFEGDLGPVVPRHDDVEQQQLVSQGNDNETFDFATAVAVAVDVAVANDGDTKAGENGVNASSDADADADIDSGVTQQNFNNVIPSVPFQFPTAATTDDGASITQSQAVEQENENENLSVATAVGVAGDVAVARKGDTEAGANGVNAVSDADADADIGSGNTVQQTNANDLTAFTEGEGAPITQSQLVDQGQILEDEPEEGNINEELLIGTAVAVSGDVAVSNVGDTHAGASGVNAESNAGAESVIDNRVAQSNANRAQAETSGDGSLIAQGLISLDALFEGQDPFTLISAEGEQRVAQSNFNGEIAVATSVAVAGNVAVESVGDTNAVGRSGVNATSNASAAATIVSGVNQNNVNDLFAETTGDTGEFNLFSIPFVISVDLITPSSVVQDQAALQSNINREALIATSVAVAGDVAVLRDGNTAAGLDGVNAASTAQAGAAVASGVNQSNDNGANAATTGTGAFISQGGFSFSVGIPDLVDLEFAANGGQEVGQSNDNAQLGLATAFAESGDVAAGVYGDTLAGENGVNAVSSAAAEAGLLSNVDQSNTNALSASTQGEPGGLGAVANIIFVGEIEVELPFPALIVQNQVVEQSNFNGQLLAATSIATSGDVAVEREGYAGAGLDGVNAVSSSSATASIESSVTQTNENRAIATTQGDGALILQAPVELSILDIVNIEVEGGQDVEQINTNLQGLFATSISFAGDVNVGVYGDTDAGENGVNAVSEAYSVATIESGDTVSQSNFNSLAASTDGDLAIIGQDQGFIDQSNINAQLLFAGSGAFSGEVGVTVVGDTYSGDDGVEADSDATALAGVENSVEQSSENQLGAFTTGTAAAISQTQEGEQVNFNVGLSVAAADAQSEDVDVAVYGDIYAGDEAIDAESEALALAGVKSSVDQSNINGPFIPMREEIVAEEAVADPDPEPEEPVVPTGSTEGGLGILIQDQSIEQVNFNGQILAAATFAVSDEVNVFGEGDFYAGDNGIEATSEAVAGSGVFSKVTQSNDNALNGSATGPLAILLQTQGAVQINANLESANALAIAGSEDVTVEHWGDIGSGEDGINATSSAAAGAITVQKADQSNTNSADATGSLIVQLQGALQVNANVQDGNAIAFAESEDVDVIHSGEVYAGDDGIDATSAAKALAVVAQKAEQSNDNSARIALGPSEGDPEPGSEIPDFPDFLDGFGIGVQGQLAGQINVNLQSGEAIASAIADDVNVYAENDPAQDNGILATSSAKALGVVYQDAVQTNQNSASIELPVEGLGIGLQGGIGVQANLNGQQGQAAAVADGDDVYVDQYGNLDAGNDGIRATSVAEAGAIVYQGVEQSNADAKSIAPVETDLEDPVFGVAVQIEGALQANLSRQEGAAVAEAVSDTADIDAAGELWAGDDGLSAKSLAEAEAGVIQKADQSNENDLDATGAIVAQVQIPLQLNLNSQEGVAFAGANSGEVEVKQFGTLNVGDDGIKALSNAEAGALVEQEAAQRNDNSAAATIEGDLTLPGDDLPNPEFVDEDGPLGIAVQLQGGLQINASEQSGIAAAEAASGEVRVFSQNDPAGDDAITAASEAKAGAGVAQTVDQSNVNSAAATFTAPDVTIPEIPVTETADLGETPDLPDATGAPEGTETQNEELQTPEFDLASRLPDNIPEVASQYLQDALPSDGLENVPEEASGNIPEQELPEQAVTDIPEGELPEQQQAELPSEVDVDQTDGLDIALQGQLLGQVNLNSQTGLAIATADSDTVSVEQAGALEAGDDGIKATSEAASEAVVRQEATQANENAATATFEGPEVDITAGGEEVVVDVLQIDGLDLGLQGQLIGQLNASTQRGAAVSTALADDVYVDQSGSISVGDDAISATSDANANGAVVQTAAQSNDNSADVEFGGAQADISATADNVGEVTIEQIAGPDIGIQGQAVGQLNVSGQAGAAISTAVSGEVNVWSQNDPAGDDGIKATSAANANAAVIQTVGVETTEGGLEPGQTNTNSAGANFSGAQANLDLTVTDGDGGALLDDEGDFDLALQGQAIGQINLSEQGGIAVATAISDDVNVAQSGVLDAGGNGIAAASTATAEAPVIQTASQSNDNSAAAIFDGQQINAGVFDAQTIEGEFASGDGPDVAIQGQLVGQVNLSSQEGAAIATALSDDVRVWQSGTMSVGGDGITASSAAEAFAPVKQDATQANSNSGEESLFGGTTDFSDQGEPNGSESGFDLAVQGQLVGQINLSNQAGLAVATAVSDSVNIWSQDDPAGGNGIVATSSAKATAPVIQTASQSNNNSASATFTGQSADIDADGQPEVDLLQIDGSEFALQLQGVGQVNLSRQRGLSVATAVSDDVIVEQSGTLEAGKSGILATSIAEATAPVMQTASQANSNSATATFEGSQADIDAEGAAFILVQQGQSPEQEEEDGTVNLAIQGQLVGQANLSTQGGLSVATAVSDDVTVDQSGTLTVGADGIVATSEALAEGVVAQDASQSNDNSAAQTFSGDQANVTANLTGEEELDANVNQIDGLDLGIQGQIVGQANLNVQGGASIATAVSGDVMVSSRNDPAGGDGINATSAADADAAVVQDSEQSNTNSAEATYEGSQTDLDLTADGAVDVDVFEANGLDLAVQGQLVGQVNLNGQRGAAIATAISDDANVAQIGTLEAGGTGIAATSSAVATAPLAQTVSQSNENSAAATFTGSQTDVDVAAEDADVVIQEFGDLRLAFQGQALGQINLSGQRGLAVATAVSDEVKIWQSGTLDAGGDGIVATSSAEALAPVVQTATQSNLNTAEADFGGSQTNVDADTIDLDVTVIADQELDLGLQGQILGQLNVSTQLGGAISTAVSDEVTVAQSGTMSAGGNGIVATSQARAGAGLVQNADQSNVNTASQIFEPSQIEVVIDEIPILDVEFDGPNVGLQGQLAGQVNLNGQGGLSVATADSDTVTVISKKDPAGKDGINATSSADATAAVVQNVGTIPEEDEDGEPEPGQSNVNNANIVLPGDDGNDEEDFALQLAGALQVNVNAQGGVAVATAESGDVYVDQSGPLEAGNNGIVATSVASAAGVVDQTAVQSNESIGEIAPFEEPIEVVELELTEEIPALTIQGQAVGQVNVNAQGGLATAFSFSDTVNVHKSGTLDVGENGIVATSAAVAGAAVVQAADQSNVAALNSAAEEPIAGQLVGQLNVNIQEGLAIGVAVADDVNVYSETDPAGNDGIVAASQARTLAGLDQSAYQSNESTIDADGELVGQLAGQLNVSVQEGAAIGVALSDDVSVEQSGTLKAGNTGIDASSTAAVQAEVNQDVYQSNEADPGLAAQENFALQRGLAVGFAASGKVSVVQKGKLTAGGTGIKAVSGAASVASLNQDAEQYNGVDGPGTNTHLFSGFTAAISLADTVSVQSDDVNAGGDGVVGISTATAQAFGGAFSEAALSSALEEAPELAAAAETLAVEQILLLPSTFALALADQVHIVTKGDIVAGGYGVYALSYAKAEAEADDGGSSLAIARSDDVKVEVNGDITAGKHGVYAASIAEATGDVALTSQGNVTVKVKKGTVTGGNGYYGIAVAGGDDNTITIGKKGTVTSLSNDAILGGDFDETVNNSGMVIGNVDLGGGSNAFNNLSSGSFYTADIIDLNGGLLTNWGVLSPGGPGSIQTTELNGSLEQKGSGKYDVDIDMGNAKSDRINATGTAELNGKVRGSIIKNVETGKETVTILTADGGATEAAKAVDTALVDYSVGTSGPNDVVLNMNVNFAAKGLDKEGTSLGQHLNKAFKNGNKKLDKLGVALVNLEELGDVVDAYNELDGENYRALSMSTLYAAEAFQNDLMSCAVRDGDAYAFIDEDQCIYARVRFGNLDYDANAGTSGFDEDAISITGGAQWTLNGPWHAGVAAGYENSDISTNGPRLSSDGDRFHIGGSLKYINGPWFFGGTLAGGWTDYDSSRSVSIPGFASTQRSSQDVTDFGGQFRAAYLMTSGNTYFKPLVDLNLTYVDMDGFTERGGAAALRFNGSDETVFSASPALEIGTQMALSGGTLVRPFARGGVSFYSDGDFALASGFAGAPGVAPFRTTGEIDDVVGTVAAGLTVLGTGNGVLTFSYDGAFGDDLEAHTGSAKASWRF